MSDRPKITKIEVIGYAFDVQDMERWPEEGVLRFSPGATARSGSTAVRIHTDQGVTGEYVGGYGHELTLVPAFLHALLGQDALDRERIYRRAKHATRQAARLGAGIIDAALWDIAGKYYDAPVYELLGGHRQRIPCYASTYIGDEVPGGLDTPEAYADFAERCYEIGYRAFKIHPWYVGPVARQEEVVRAVGERVGDRMTLMMDPACALETFGDAWRVGRACDDHRYFWYEDPFKEGGVSAQAHRKLRELISTPLLIGEHIRGIEAKVDLLVSGGTDYVRGDPVFDGGITGVMKLAHVAEGFGLDIELHMCGPAWRHLISAIPNTNYYEMGLVHPGFGTLAGVGPVYACDYRDDLEAVGPDGCVEPPSGPGLGVTFDWDFIERNRTGGTEYAL